MIKNFFFLARQISELAPLISGARLTDIFSQEADTVVFHIFKDELNDIFLEINCDQHRAFILGRQNFAKAKKNVMQFFSACHGQTIKEISIAFLERIIKFDLESGSLFFMIKGNDTNLFFLTEDGLQSFKSFAIDESDTYITLFQNLDYLSALEINSRLSEWLFRNCSGENLHAHQALGPEVRRQISLRISAVNYHSIKETIGEIINEILNQPIILTYSKDTLRYRLLPYSFMPESVDKLKQYDRFNDALLQYIIDSHKYVRFTELYRKGARYFKTEIEFRGKRILSLKQTLAQANLENEYKQLGNALLSNFHRLQKGAKNISVLLSERDENEITISLDPKLSPQKNVDRYFEKARNIRIRVEEAKEKLPDLRLELEALKKLFHEFEKIDTVELLEQFIKVHKVKIQNQNDMDRSPSSSSKYRRFLIEEKYQLFVGKDSSNNDELTLHFAKNDDYWFHARSVSGSHVVLRSPTPKEPPPKNILKIAASVAAFYSKAKSSGLVPVAFTQKKYVSKRRGMPPGMVSLQKESVLLVKPEIPKLCIPIENEF